MASLSFLSKIFKRSTLRQTKVSGFTLLELLVSMLVAGIIVSGLLYLVVELLQIDRREAALDQTQRDMQRALNYMADDIREAVYIYSTPSTVTGTGKLDDLPSGTPVLAFWRPVPIETIPSCAPWSTTGTSPNVTKFDQCQVLAIRQASYSLVVYVQKARTSSDVIWEGASRIIRYELDKYKGSLTTLTLTPGYQDPTTPGVGFDAWEKALGSTTEGTSTVLVDFVDSPTATVSSAPNQSCTAAVLGAGYTVVPASATTTTSNTSFFGCVRDPGGAAANGSNSNQDVYLFLRGNAVEGAQGSVNSFSESSSLPTLKTRVLMRGVVNKNPN
jgi:prepilin-type N-terminal cleavage/methylation domain-containing protein